MIYPSLSLSGTGFILGLLLMVAYGLCLWKSPQAKVCLSRLPRSRRAGVVLLSAAAIWAFYLIRTMDLGEFSSYRTAFSILIPVAYYLTLTYVDEFLAVRALGMLMLLVAEPILEAAFLKPELSRLLIVVVAYIMIVKGMFFVGMPFLMRDGIQWATKSDSRWRAGLWAGLAYGAVIVLASLTLYR